MQREKPKAGLADVDTDTGRAFIKHLMERKTKYENHVFRQEQQESLSPQTIHGYVRAMRPFASWLEHEGGRFFIGWHVGADQEFHDWKETYSSSYCQVAHVFLQ